MPRHLTGKQKKILDQYPDAVMAEDIPNDAYDKLVTLNDYETIYQDIDRYLWDRSSADRFRKARLV